MVNNKFVLLSLLILLISVLINPTAAQNRKINDFDIEKVRQAAGVPFDDTAIDQANAPFQIEKEEPGIFLITFRIVGYLVLLTIVIFGAVWGIKRLGFASSSKVGGGSMDLLEALPLGQNRSLLLVRVMDGVLVLSQTPQQIQLLDKIEGQKAVELIASGKGGTSIVQFKDVFNKFVDKIKKNP